MVRVVTWEVIGMKAHVVEKWLSTVLTAGEVVLSEIEVSVGTRVLGEQAGYSAQMMLTEKRILIYGKSWLGEFSQIIERSTVTSVVANTQFIQGTLLKATLVTISHSGTESHFPTTSKNFSDFVQQANTPTTKSVQEPQQHNDLAQDLSKLSELYEKGLLTAEEFQHSKKRLLD